MKPVTFATPGQQGFSLVELMISVTIGLLLVAAMGTLVANNSAHRQEVEQASRQIENGRYAVQVIGEDLHHAGFFGEYNPLTDIDPLTFAPPLPTALPDPCNTTPATLDDAMPLAIQGYDAPGTLPAALAACLDAANWVAGTDILLVRRAATTTTALASLTTGRVYLQSRPAGYVLNDGSAGAAAFTLTKKDGTTLADIRQYTVHIYFLSPCSVPSGSANCSAAADGGKPIPTLKRLELTDNGAGGRTMKVVPMVEGIEALEIDYGIDTSPAPSTGTPDTYRTIPASLAEWGNVVAARIQLVARNNEASPGFTDAKTYDMGLAGTYTPTELTFKRHAYTQLVRLVNPSSRREQ